MAASTSYGSFTKRIAVSLTAAVVFLAWGPLTPARGQCSLHELTKLIRSDTVQRANFGHSVAVSGDTAVVGANGYDPNTDAGSAYVFVRSGGVWTQQQKLTPSDTAVGDRFGATVAVSGDTAVVGAQNQFIGPGSAYVFVRTGTTWTQQQKLTASDAVSSGYFSYSVAVSGDTAVVGNPLGNPNSVYVFVRTSGVWTQQQKLSANAGASSYFGISVAVSGDTAVVGDGVNNPNSSYVFVRSGGVWGQQAVLTASDAASAHSFGGSVALSGDTVVVGATGGDGACPGDPECGSGSAYVFVKPPGGWTNMTQTAKLTASDAARGDQFSASVAVSGDTAVIGAPSTDEACSPGQNHCDSGSAYVFVRPSNGWVNTTETAKLTASDASTQDIFGYSVAVSGDTAVVGKPQGLVGGADVFSSFADCNHNGVPDACDIGSGTSQDVINNLTGAPGADGIPDECSQWNTPNPTNDRWSTPVNWQPPDAFPNNGNGSPPRDFSATVAGAANVQLDVNVAIDSLVMGSGAQLHLAQRNMTTALPAGIQNNGVIDGVGLLSGAVRNESTIDANGPGQTLEIAGGFTGVNNGTLQASNGGTLLISRTVGGTGNFVAEGGTLSVPATLSIPGATAVTVSGATLDVLGGGAVNIDGLAEVNVTGHVHLTCGSLRGCIRPILNISSGPGVNVGGNFSLADDADVTVGAATTFNLAGNFDNQSTGPTTFHWDTGPVTMNGQAPQTFEAAGNDYGPRNPAGYVNNFAMGTLRIDPGRTLDFVNTFDNYLNGTACEVLYVDTLSLGAGSTLVLNGCNVYYRTLIKESGASVVALNGSGVMSTSAGDLDGDNILGNGDIAQMANVLLGGSCNAACMALADLNGDGQINGADIPLLVRLLTGW